jgi:succinyl-CoA synthetase beta subunit
MKIHEYQAKELLAHYGVPTPKGKVATNVTEAEWIATDLMCWPRRREGAGPRRRPRQGRRREAGPQDMDDAPGCHAAAILGTCTIKGHHGPQTVLVEPAVDIRHEIYLGRRPGPRDAAPRWSSRRAAGGVDIEELAHTTPEADPQAPDPADLRRASPTTPRVVASFLRIPAESRAEVLRTTIIDGLVKAFVRIRLLARRGQPARAHGRGATRSPCDGKINFDDNALYVASGDSRSLPRRLGEEEPLEVDRAPEAPELREARRPGRLHRERRRARDGHHGRGEALRRRRPPTSWTSAAARRPSRWPTRFEAHHDRIPHVNGDLLQHLRRHRALRPRRAGRPRTRSRQHGHPSTIPIVIRLSGHERGRGEGNPAGERREGREQGNGPDHRPDDGRGGAEGRGRQQGPRGVATPHSDCLSGARSIDRAHSFCQGEWLDNGAGRRSAWVANRRTNRKTRPGSVSGVARMSITLCAGETPTPPSKAPPSARWIPTDWARDQVTIATTRKHRLIIGGWRGRPARVGGESKHQPEDPSGFGQWRGASVYRAIRGRDARATFKSRSTHGKITAWRAYAGEGADATDHERVAWKRHRQCGWLNIALYAGRDARATLRPSVDHGGFCLWRYTRARTPMPPSKGSGIGGPASWRRLWLSRYTRASRPRTPWPRVDHWRVAWASRPRGWQIEGPTGRPVRVRSVVWR